MAHLNPIRAVALSSSKNLLVPGDNQYALSPHDPPLYTLDLSEINVVGHPEDPVLISFPFKSNKYIYKKLFYEK